MTTLLPYQTTQLKDEIGPCEKSRLTLRRFSVLMQRQRQDHSRLLLVGQFMRRGFRNI